MAYEGWDSILQRRYDYGSQSGQDDRRKTLEELRAEQQRRLDDLAGRFRRATPSASSLQTPSPWQSEWAQGQVTALTNQQDAAEAMGLWDQARNVGTEAFGGLLDTTVNTLDALRGGSMGLISGTLNSVGQLAENAGIDNPLDEWTADPYNPATAVDDYKDTSFENNPFGRAIAGFTNQKEWGAGDFRGPLQYQEDDGFLERAAKATGAFVTDTALDPLTYLTFGVGSVGKKAVQEGIEAVSRRIATNMSDEAATTLAARAPIAREVQAAVDSGERGFAARRLSEVLGREVKEADIEKTFDDKLFKRRLAGDALTDEAVGAYTRRSARGLRDYLKTSDLGEETAQEFWKALPTGARGGVRFAVPFTRKESGALLRSSTVDRLGLGKVADLGSRGSLWLRTTAPVQAARKRFSGAAGDAWNEYLTKTAKNLDASYTRDYSAWAKALRQNRATRAHLKEASVLVLRDLSQMIDSMEGENDKLLASARRYLTSGTKEVPKEASNIDRGGFLIAQAFRNVLDDRFDQLVAAGMDVNKVQDYWPRVASEEYLRGKAAKAPLRSSKGTGAGGYQPDKAREAFQKLVGQSEDGKLIFKWQSLDEANKVMLNEGMPAVFETDPFKILSVYLASTDRMLAATDLSRSMERSGILYTGERDIRRFLEQDAVAAAVTTGRRTLDEFARRSQNPTLEDAVFEQAATRGPLDTWMPPEYLDSVDLEDISQDELDLLRRAEEAAKQRVNVDELTARLDEVLQSDENVLTYIRNAPVGDPKALDEYVGNLVVVLHDISELKRVEVDETVRILREQGNERLADKVRTAYAREIGDVRADKLTTTRRVASNVDDSLPDFGRLNAPVGNDKAPDLSGLPRAWDDETLVPDAIRKSVQQHFTRMPSRKAIDDFYAPFLSAWKLSATVGRGPGYIARNVIGAWWNNFLVGVNNRHYREAARMFQAREKARRYADKRTAQRKGTSADWEMDYFFRFEQAVKGNKRLVAAERAWQRSGMGANNYNLEAIGANLTEASTSGQLMDQAARGGRTWLTEGPAVDLFVRSSNPDTAVKRGLNKAANNPYFKTWSRASNVSEEFVRTASFLRGIDVYGLDDAGDAAATMVRATQFDYADLSPFERDVARMLVPFYTWTRNNVPLQLRAMFLDPRKPLGAVRLQEELQAAFGYDYENDPDALPYDALNPQYSVDRQGFAVDPRWVPDFMESEAGPLVLQMENPVNDVNVLIPKNPLSFDGWKEKGRNFALSSLTPALKAPGSVITNTDLSTGAPFSEKGMPAASWANLLGLSRQDVDSEGQLESRMDPLLGVTVREFLPPVGVFDRLYTGPGSNEASQDRKTSNWLSFFGAPVRTATEEQLGGTARGVYEKRQQFIEQEAIAMGIDPAQVREYLIGFPDGPAREQAKLQVRSMIEQGYFRLPPQED